jgi:hypothetical protein
MPLKLELLEARDCPTGITLEAVVLTDHMVQLSGHVDGENAAGSTIWFTGAVQTSTTADSNGDYSITTGDATLGNVYAAAWFNESPFTDTVSDAIEVAAPSINFGITDMTDETVTISGTLVDIDFAYQPLIITGIEMDPVSTDWEGNFRLSMSRATLDTVTVSEENLWGLPSNVIEIDGANLPPFIRDFTAEPFGNCWTFRGRVVGNDVAGLTVTFGGIACMIGQTATVGSDGWFEFAMELPSGVAGFVTAQTTQNGVNSNLASRYVSQN